MRTSFLNRLIGLRWLSSQSLTLGPESLKIGQQRITNVVASIGNVSSPLLLGQSFLEKTGAWGIDGQSQKLVVGRTGTG